MTRSRYPDPAACPIDESQESAEECSLQCGGSIREHRYSRSHGFASARDTFPATNPWKPTTTVSRVNPPGDEPASFPKNWLPRLRSSFDLVSLGTPRSAAGPGFLVQSRALGEGSAPMLRCHHMTCALVLSLDSRCHEGGASLALAVIGPFPHPRTASVSAVEGFNPTLVSIFASGV
jgi:hypothetical protein